MRRPTCFTLGACLALSALAASAHAAGVRMLSETTDLASGAVTKVETLLDQTRLRVNITSPRTKNSVLFLTDGGRDRMVMLDPAKNEYMEMDKATMDSMAQQMSGVMAEMQKAMEKMKPEQRAMMEKMMKGQMKGMPGAAAPAKTTYSAAGSSSANGFSCTKYNATRAGQKVAELCAASPSALKFNQADFAVFERMKDFVAGMAKAAENSPFGGMVNTSGFIEPGFQGIPVTQTQFSSGKPVSKTDLKSVQSATFSAADFSLGSAKKRELPQMKQ